MKQIPEFQGERLTLKHKGGRGKSTRKQAAERQIARIISFSRRGGWQDHPETLAQARRQQQALRVAQRILDVAETYFQATAPRLFDGANIRSWRKGI